MENNCLVKKLKKNTNNNNLLELGTLKFKVANTSNAILGAFSKMNPIDGSKKIRATIDNGSFYHGETSIGNDVELVPYGSWLSIKTTSTATVRIKDKYNLSQIQIEKYDGASGNNTRAWAEPRFTSDYVFDIEELSPCNSLTLFGGVCDLKGDIVKAFGHLNTMTELCLYCGALTGDIKDLVAKFVANSGNQSGTIPAFGLKKLTSPLYSRETDWNITFNGRPISTPGISEALVWESTSKIYIDRKSDNRIICIGYSDAEIATNTASGGIWEGVTQVIKFD